MNKIILNKQYTKEAEREIFIVPLLGILCSELLFDGVMVSFNYQQEGHNLESPWVKGL